MLLLHSSIIYNRYVHIQYKKKIVKIWKSKVVVFTSVPVYILYHGLDKSNIAYQEQFLAEWTHLHIKFQFKLDWFWPGMMKCPLSEIIKNDNDKFSYKNLLCVYQHELMICTGVVFYYDINDWCRYDHCSKS